MSFLIYNYVTLLETFITMAREITPRILLIYSDSNGNEPFTLWLESLELPVQARIRQRLRRIEVGHFGDYKPVGEGVFELRFFFGSGYRVYFGEEDNSLVLLLLGGDKKTQKRDIKKAQEYWDNHKKKAQEEPDEEL